MTKDYRLIAIRRFCSYIVNARISQYYAVLWCPGGSDWSEQY